MLHSNYNVLTLSIRMDGKFKVGDVYTVPETERDLKHRRFNGLQIKRIDYVFGVRLHFDYSEWASNIPQKICNG
jgi:hypothetical protein